MKQIRNLVKNAKIGNIVPVVETLPYALDPVDYFLKLSDYGTRKNCLLFESADIIPKYGGRSLGSADPCLKMTGKKENFEILALNDLGVKLIDFIKGDFDFCDELTCKKTKITGKLKPKKKTVSEEERLKLINHMDIIRKVAFKFKPTMKPFIPYGGLFGSISYDFIDQFEDLPKNKLDLTNEPDYVFYFLDNLFMVDHGKKTTYFVANALVMDNEIGLFDKCMSKIEKYKKIIGKNINFKRANTKIDLKIQSDTTKEEFIDIVNNIKGNIKSGDVYQAVPSRTIIIDCNKKPIDIYKKLKKINPSPYMFYVNSGEDVLLGASPEMNLRVQGDSEKTVEIRPIAGTKPRGMTNNDLDLDLDSRYETELKIDKKEISEHTMLVDLARNDVARICRPGSRYADEPFIVEKYSHVQHLVTNVKGILKEDLDALHAYVATMNMGTLTGAPKVQAMKLLRQYEKTKRGFYGGCVGYITPSKDMDTAITIRSVKVKGNKIYLRVGAGIVYDSDPEAEFLETERKGFACLKAIGD